MFEFECTRGAQRDVTSSRTNPLSAGNGTVLFKMLFSVKHLQAQRNFAQEQEQELGPTQPQPLPGQAARTQPLPSKANVLAAKRGW